jgi:hypothetical protein
VSRWALVLVVLVAATAAAVLVAADDPADDTQTTAAPREPPVGKNTQPAITQPAHAAPCPSQHDSNGHPRPTTSSFDARELLGMTEREAERTARPAGCSVRVVKRDGEFLARTDDVVVSRINVEVEAGIVVALEGVN